MIKRDSFAEFLNDIKPLFHTQRVSYVDVGAYVGETFREFLAAGFKPDEVFLIEPNPRSLEQLQSSIRAIEGGPKTLNVYNVALSSKKGRIRLRAAKDMTRVDARDESRSLSRVSRNTFEVEATTLDSLADDLLVRHISVLKIDVEGHELEVLKGATQLLSNESIDIIYIEAGMSRDVKQQCYYRDIEDALLPYGYRPFRFYEQTHEWMNDSPVLRRVNAAYISRAFSQRMPLRLTQELYDCKAQLRYKDARLAELQSKSDSLAVERDDLRRHASKLQDECTHLRGQVASLTQHCATLQERITALEQRSASLDSYSKDLQTQIEQLLQEHHSAAAELLRLRAESTEHADAAKENAKLISENETLRLEVSRAQKDVAAITAQLTAFAADWATAALRQQDFLLKLQPLEVDQERVASELRTLEAQVCDTLNFAKSLSSEFGALTSERDLLRSKVAHLQDSLTQAQNDLTNKSQLLSDSYEQIDALRKTLSRAQTRTSQLEQQLERAHTTYRLLAARLAGDYKSALKKVIDDHESILSTLASGYREREAVIISALQREHQRAMRDIEQRFHPMLRAYRELQLSAQWYETAYHKLLRSRSWRLGAIFRFPRRLFRQLLAVLNIRQTHVASPPPSLDSPAVALRSMLDDAFSACTSARKGGLTLPTLPERPTPASLKEPHLTMRVEDFGVADDKNCVNSSTVTDLHAPAEPDHEELQRLRFQLARAQEELDFLRQQLDTSEVPSSQHSANSLEHLAV